MMEKSSQFSRGCLGKPSASKPSLPVTRISRGHIAPPAGATAEVLASAWARPPEQGRSSHTSESTAHAFGQS